MLHISLGIYLLLVSSVLIIAIPSHSAASHPSDSQVIALPRPIAGNIGAYGEANSEGPPW